MSRSFTMSRALLIDFFVVIALLPAVVSASHAGKGYSSMNEQTDKQVVVVGDGVIKREFVPKQERFFSGPDVECDLYETIGGAACELTRKLQKLGVSTQTLLAVGTQEGSVDLQQRLDQEITGCNLLRVYDQTKTSSVVRGQPQHISVSKVDREQLRLPTSAVDAVKHGALTLLCPLTPGGCDFDRKILRLSPRAVTLLPTIRRDDVEAAVDLARRSWLTVVNQQQLQQLVGTRNPNVGILRLRQRGARNVLVICPFQIVAAIDGQVVRQTSVVDLGDYNEPALVAFVATFACLVVNGSSTAIAVGWGLAHAVTATTRSKREAGQVRTPSSVSNSPNPGLTEMTAVALASLATGLAMGCLMGVSWGPIT